MPIVPTAEHRCQGNHRRSLTPQQHLLVERDHASRGGEKSPSLHLCTIVDCKSNPAPRRRDYLLFEFRVFRFGFLKNGEIGVRVFHSSEEILVGGLGFTEIALQGVRPAKPEV